MQIREHLVFCMLVAVCAPVSACIQLLPGMSTTLMWITVAMMLIRRNDDNDDDDNDADGDGDGDDDVETGEEEAD